MLYFRNGPWLCVRGGATAFSAYISISNRKRADVMWSMNLRYMTAGAAWRRVHGWERPSLWIEVNHFQVPGHGWTGLEAACYWDLPDESMSWNDYIMDYESPAGGIEAHYYPHSDSKEDEQLELYDVVWRVAARRGRWFTVELAALYDGRETQRELREQPVVVTPEGKEEPADPDAEFWKAHATFYLVEEIPFRRRRKFCPLKISRHRDGPRAAQRPRSGGLRLQPRPGVNRRIVSAGARAGVRTKRRKTPTRSG